MSATWVALGQALTGELLTAPTADRSRPDAGADPLAEVAAPVEVAAPEVAWVVEWLHSCGWTTERLAAHRLARQDSELVWPHPVEPAERGGLGAAQFHALLAELRRALGLTGLTASRREGPKSFDAGDLRLLAERPPHHG